MKILPAIVISSVASILAAQSAPTLPAVKWRGSLWGSGVESDKTMAEGTVPFQEFLTQGNGELAFDGATLGADVALASGWSLKFTLLGGNLAKVLNTTDGETGSLALAEAQLIWTGASDTFKFGRMWTPLGMEVADQSLNITASRGILFCNVLPLSQVGLDWHHAFGASFSTDAYVINGEDKIKDNNQGKTYGLQFTYNHGGASDKFITLLLFRGPEQNGLRVSDTENYANTGAEGRQQERASLSGQWVWGASTLQWEADYLSKPDALDVKTKTKGAGAIFKQQFTDTWAAFARAEYIKSTVEDSSAKLTSFCVGGEKKWGATFARLELRRDSADSEVYTDIDGKPFKSANSVTFSLGSSF